MCIRGSPRQKFSPPEQQTPVALSAFQKAKIEKWQSINEVANTNFK
jgi:hypothetical protein